MRILITGSAGFAGRHMASLCADVGCSAIFGIGRRSAAEADPPAELDSYESVDLSDPAQTTEAIRSVAPDRIFHLAAEASVASSWDDPARVITSNTCTTLNLLEAIRLHARGARVLIAGSGEEYGEPERLPVTEEHPLRPQNPYAVSKASIDLAAGFYAATYEMHVLRTRAFNHAGPGQRDSYVVSNLARQIAEAEASPDNAGYVEVVTGNLDVKRDFTDVRDVVRAYWLLLEHARAGVYNVCSGRSVAISGILGKLAGYTQLEVGTRTDPKRLRRLDVTEIQGSHERLSHATGWQPEISLEQTLQELLDWWRARTRAEVTS
jgi:GDP-4-dehydro-6-deoxy-D-mannose reductase